MSCSSPAELVAGDKDGQVQEFGTVGDKYHRYEHCNWTVRAPAGKVRIAYTHTHTDTTHSHTHARTHTNARTHACKHAHMWTFTDNCAPLSVIFVWQQVLVSLFHFADETIIKSNEHNDNIEVILLNVLACGSALHQI